MRTIKRVCLVPPIRRFIEEEKRGLAVHSSSGHVQLPPPYVLPVLYLPVRTLSDSMWLLLHVSCIAKDELRTCSQALPSDMLFLIESETYCSCNLHLVACST